MTFQPSTEYQLDFLKRLQRIFNEGEFVATYKFALLHALADICVEHDAAADGSLHVPLRCIGEKFLELYWHHAEPYRETGTGSGVLKQNTKGQAQIVSRLEDARASFPTISRFRRSEDWKPAVTFATAQIKDMPLWRLQTLGGVKGDFLYVNEIVDHGIILKPGVAASLRAFYPLVLHLVRGHWISHIRRIPANSYLVGDHADLEYFLFGTQRGALEKARPVLDDLQAGCCFYCRKPMRGDWQVDHFIPWARYPRDLGHNFVLAHASCNQQKSDTLAGRVHVENWLARNAEAAPRLTAELGESFLCDEATSRRIARWSYELDASAAAQLWLRSRHYETCNHHILSLF